MEQGLPQMNVSAWNPSSTAGSVPVAIRADQVCKAFGDRQVLDGVDFAISQGSIVAIVGESGCGKSTLLRLFAGLDTATSGVAEISGTISIAFQDSRLLPWLKVWENVAFGLRASKVTRRRKAFAVLEEVGLRRLCDAWPATLSGGEGQRVALARSLIRDPSILLLDEPFGALDALTRLRMHALLQGLWNSHGFTRGSRDPRYR
jgi:sulfonate transport system ATP-binding protein